MSRFLKDKYSNLKPYVPGEQPEVTGRLVKLNTNENPYPPAPGVCRITDGRQPDELRLYPDPDTAVLTKAIAENFGLNKSQVITGNGTDEILAFVFMAFGGKSNKVYYPEISYSFYPVYCDIFESESVKVPLRRDFSISPCDYYDADGMIVITNPNAPTGMALDVAQIEDILIHNRDNPVIIDEAYVDFGADSAVRLIDMYDNLLVVQTFSKSRSLAGARIGYALGNEDMISDLNTIKFSFNPYNLDRRAILAGTEAMKDREYFDKTRKQIIDTRESFSREMRNLGFTVLPSKANFVFVSSGEISGSEYFRRLREKNIIVRHFNDEKISDFVRITIGTPEEMELLLDATAKLLNKTAGEKK